MNKGLLSSVHSRSIGMTDRELVSPENDDAEFEKALLAVIGVITPEEAARRVQDIYRWREEGSRPMHMITATRSEDDPVWAMLTPERIDAATRALFGAPDTESELQNAGLQENGRD
jgi:hypothetical protein